MRKRYPTPTGAMEPHMMPGYWTTTKDRATTTAPSTFLSTAFDSPFDREEAGIVDEDLVEIDNVHISALLTTICEDGSQGHDEFSHVPVRFESAGPDDHCIKTNLHFHFLTETAAQCLQFVWVVNGFNNGQSLYIAVLRQFGFSVLFQHLY